jgi:prepilin peptidase CpaA
MQPISQSLVANADTANSIPALLALAVMLAVAVYMELKEERIPNCLTFSGMALGLLIGYLHGTAAFWSSIGGLAIGFGFLFVFYVFGGIGGGDVKLMGAAGALMGSELIKPALVYTAFLGAFLAVMIVIWRKDFWIRIGQGLQRLAFWRKENKEQIIKLPPVTVPYGIAIAVGCLLALIVKGAV